MDEIIVCTEKDVYMGGDCVYGCVYMNISSPVGASSVVMRIQGYENYMFHTEYDDHGEQCVRVVQDTKEHIKQENIQIYTTPGAIRCGRYMFPFKTVLPPNIPASFHFQDDVLEASIVYQIICELGGSEDIQGTKILLVHEMSPRCSSYVHKTIDLKGILPFMSSTLEITTSLNKSAFLTGETMRLSIDFLKSGKGKADIDSVALTLVQNLRLTFRNLADPGKNFTRLIWQGELCSDNGVELIKGLKNFMVPLRCDKESRILAQSTFGSHVICSYCLNVDIALNGTVVKLCQSIPSVRHKAKLSKDVEPDWAPLCICERKQVHKHTISAEDYDHYEQLRNVREVLAGLR